MDSLASIMALNSRREGIDLMQIELLIDIVRQLGEHSGGNLLVSHFDRSDLSPGFVVVVVVVLHHHRHEGFDKNRSVS